ncbi:PucR family transcriptional regulator [Mycobacterium paraterrae]|uniref:Helix-turn-helix domain-containing protein n=1 Tax=Mycobacterium paraterrae TaxID=577492 RepID=A0ABY3VIL8_9MYCO|nr:helix-turn-helix domain-containing protein [Mycobacterium paraterrae]UMB68471.1 helix-turn-helix domain-containing protein [Mycobacterium paraterrae]
MPAESVVAQLAELGDALLSRADELADTMLALMRREVGFHRTVALVSDEDLRSTVREHLGSILGAFGAATPGFDTRAAAETGRNRAAAGVPLAAVMDSYRLCARFIWDELAAEAAGRNTVTDAGVVGASSAMWRVLEEFTTAMVTGYQQEMARQFVDRQQERSAMVQALIDGRLADTVDLWNTADTLRISLQGPYLVVCAELASIGRSVLPGIEGRLAARGIYSAWRLQPDIEIGILQLGPEGVLDTVVEALSGYGETRVGISPPIPDLADTAGALRYARIAMTAGRPDRGPVTVFDRDVLAVTTAAAPEVMGRIAANVLGPLDDLPGHERDALLDTLEAWFDSRGSADRAATVLFVHPNTVRQRLRKLEQYTGRALNDPRAAAELCIALETSRRVPP